MSGDAIRLTGLTIRGHHGVFEFEKRDGQDFVIDVTVWTDVSGAADDDALDKTVNYAEIAEVTRAIVTGTPRDLIEALASDIADAVLARWPEVTAEVTVHKPHAPIDEDFTDVAVTVQRGGARTRADRDHAAGYDGAGYDGAGRDDAGYDGAGQDAGVHDPDGRVAG